MTGRQGTEEFPSMQIYLQTPFLSVKSHNNSSLEAVSGSSAEWVTPPTQVDWFFESAFPNTTGFKPISIHCYCPELKTLLIPLVLFTPPTVNRKSLIDLPSKFVCCCAIPYSVQKSHNLSDTCRLHLLHIIDHIM